MIRVGLARRICAFTLLLFLGITSCQAQPVPIPVLPAAATAEPTQTAALSQAPATSTVPAPLPTSTFQGKVDWNQALNPVLSQGGEWHVIALDANGASFYEHAADTIIHPASVIKLAIGMLTVSWLEDRFGDFDQALSTGPFGAGRSYNQLLTAMLVYSEEDAAQTLQATLEQEMGGKKMTSLLVDWGAPHTELKPRRSTAREISTLLYDIYAKQLPSPRTSAYLLKCLGQVTQGDTVRLWKLKGVLPAGATIYDKRGSLTEPMIVADAGIIVLSGYRAYYLTLFGYPDQKTTFEDLDKTIADFALKWYAVQSRAQ